jgi:hypothetical protein
MGTVFVVNRVDSLLVFVALILADIVGVDKYSITQLV